MFKSINKFVFILILGLLFCGKSFSQEKNTLTTDVPAIEKTQEEGKLYGSDVKPGTPVVEFADLVAAPEKYDGKEIVVSGNVNDVCQAEGCWLVLSDGKKDVLVKTLHVFVVPKDCFNNSAQVNGIFKIKEISEEQARHLNDESKNSKIKSEDIKGPQKTFVIEAAGIKLSQGGKSGSGTEKGSCCDKSKKKEDCKDKKD